MLLLCGQLVASRLNILEMAVDDRCCPHSLVNLRSVSVDFIMRSLRIAILSELGLSLFSCDHTFAHPFNQIVSLRIVFMRSWRKGWCLQGADRFYVNLCRGHDFLYLETNGLATVHFADLKPLVNSYIQREVQIKWDVSIHGRDLYLLKPTLGPSKRFRLMTRAEEVVITRQRIGHKIPYSVPRTTDCLPALWPDSDHWTDTPGMYSVATKSWWVLHSWLIEDPLWDDSRGLHNRVSERSWILLSDMKGCISNTTLYSNQSPTDDILKLNYSPLLNTTTGLCL